MIKLDSIINDIIFLLIRDVERLKHLGINDSSGHYMLKGYDHLGLWLEHPGIIIQHTEDKDGKPLPQNMQNKEKIDAIFLLKWDNIETIMHYPERKGYDFPPDYKMKIGFELNE